MNPKRKGTVNEHRSMRFLEALGYCCIRSAASRTPWDIGHVGPAKQGNKAREVLR